VEAYRDLMGLNFEEGWPKSCKSYENLTAIWKNAAGIQSHGMRSALLYPHHVSLSAQARGQAYTDEDRRRQSGFYRGIFFGIVFSIPLWAAIIWVTYQIFQ
jgi:hypothetical protein